MFNFVRNAYVSKHYTQVLIYEHIKDKGMLFFDKRNEMNQLSNEASNSQRAPRGSDILKYGRKYRGYTQAESAACYGIEERTLRRWENDEFNPKWNDVIGLIEDVYSLKIINVLEGLAHGTTCND